MTFGQLNHDLWMVKVILNASQLRHCNLLYALSLLRNCATFIEKQLTL